MFYNLWLSILCFMFYVLYLNDHRYRSMKIFYKVKRQIYEPFRFKQT